MPKLSARNNDVPAGTYKADFVDCEETDHEQWGPGLKWVFEIAEGPHAGQFAYRTTKDKATLKNSCGKFLSALTGKPAAQCIDIDTDDYIGRRYFITVGETDSGSTRVENFISTEAIQS